MLQSCKPLRKITKMRPGTSPKSAGLAGKLGPGPSKTPGTQNVVAGHSKSGRAANIPDRSAPTRREEPASQITRRYYRARDIAGPAGFLPIGLSTFRRWVALGYLPQPVRLGARCSVWAAPELDEAIAMLQGNMRVQK